MMTFDATPDTQHAEAEATPSRKRRKGVPSGTVKRQLVRLGKTPDQCWEWLGKMSNTGAPRKTVDGKDIPARRWMWTQLFGPLPGELNVQVSCGNQTCIAPHHLVACTQAETVRAGVNTALTSADVAEIRAERRAALKGELQVDALAKKQAARFGVSVSTIHNIWSNQTWAKARRAPKGHEVAMESLC